MLIFFWLNWQLVRIDSRAVNTHFQDLLLGESIEGKEFGTLKELTTVDEYWDWIESVFVPAIYPETPDTSRMRRDQKGIAHFVGPQDEIITAPEIRKHSCAKTECIGNIGSSDTVCLQKMEYLKSMSRQQRQVNFQRPKDPGTAAVEASQNVRDVYQLDDLGIKALWYEKWHNGTIATAAEMLNEVKRARESDWIDAETCLVVARIFFWNANYRLFGLVRIETIVEGGYIKGGAMWDDRGSGLGSFFLSISLDSFNRSGPVTISGIVQALAEVLLFVLMLARL